MEICICIKENSNLKDSSNKLREGGGAFFSARF
jgi:hypothetical protein